MINVNVFRKADKITGFQIDGHAESGPYGYDLVCAGVSAVTFGAVNAVMELCNLQLEIDQASDGGFLDVKLPKSIVKDQFDQASYLFEAMLISLQTIERDYAQFIKINEGGAG
ncbi:ribosomal-processing cysteine protease Prp [Virgibacillus sp. W0430]|uniref:ribosomal-processing cysteine protease Prp n=1 Tax=Virgibacillus sp. W0430 TaxID=3391580 RepID=UPI003F44809F